MEPGTEPIEIKKSQAQVERWLGQMKVLRVTVWREGYDFLMATKPGIRYYDALLAVWLSVGKDDRGTLKTRDDFARFIGVSRAVTYQWQERRPAILDWAREIVELRFDNSRIAAVDGRVIAKATSRRTTVSWVRLFYERAGLLKTSFDLHHKGAEDGPVEYVDVTKRELDAIRDALIRDATRSAESGSPPG